jgi:ATP adenylyltransferase/5',5'''-P-1,P-4-tetraphosphate phosphorylase II
MDGATLYQRYQELLHHTKEALKDDPEQPSYNVILVHDWMMLVPRSHAHRDGVGGNAVGMVGMIWLAREEERERWEELGVMETLEFVGVKW